MLVISDTVGFEIKQLRLLPISALLRLTSLQPVTHPFTIGPMVKSLSDFLPRW
jgi:hypothetical protein